MLDIIKIINRLIGNNERKREPLEPKNLAVTQEAAVAHAKQIVAERGWAWLEPVHVVLIIDDESGRPAWSINTNILGRGCNAHIVIDGGTGKILGTHYLPR